MHNGGKSAHVAAERNDAEKFHLIWIVVHRHLPQMMVLHQRRKLRRACNSAISEAPNSGHDFHVTRRRLDAGRCMNSRA